MIIFIYLNIKWISNSKLYRWFNLTIADAPWPGFSPDLISIALVVATQANGSVLIHQKMFEVDFSLLIS